jgi:hypothetical protein
MKSTDEVLSAKATSPRRSGLGGPEPGVFMRISGAYVVVGVRRRRRATHAVLDVVGAYGNARRIPGCGNAGHQTFGGYDSHSGACDRTRMDGRNYTGGNSCSARNGTVGPVGARNRIYKHNWAQ